MGDSKEPAALHPAGEANGERIAFPEPHRVETPGGPVYVRWEQDPDVSGQGLLTYFIEFLHVSGLWSDFVEQCPLLYTSPNAPKKEEVLGTILVSVLSGHRRYAHITGIRGDTVLPKLLGIENLRSEDSIRRAFANQDEDALTLWMDGQTGGDHRATAGAAEDQRWIEVESLFPRVCNAHPFSHTPMCENRTFSARACAEKGRLILNPAVGGRHLA